MKKRHHDMFLRRHTKSLVLYSLTTFTNSHGTVKVNRFMISRFQNNTHLTFWCFFTNFIYFFITVFHLREGAVCQSKISTLKANYGETTDRIASWNFHRKFIEGLRVYYPNFMSIRSLVPEKNCYEGWKTLIFLCHVRGGTIPNQWGTSAYHNSQLEKCSYFD